MTRERQPIRSGFVLLVVIAVSVLVITALASLANISLRRALEAADAERALQARWAMLTLERTVSREMSKVFDEQEKVFAETSPSTPPPSTIRSAITLSGVTFDILLGDEDAKLNLNSLYHHAGASRVEQSVGRVVGVLVPGTLRLMPATPPLKIAREQRKLGVDKNDDEDAEDETDDLTPDAFRSWGEVFDVDLLEKQAGTHAALPTATTGITLWGNGPLNLRRASDDAIMAVVATVIQDGGARRFVQRFRKNPTVTLGVVLQTEIDDEADRERVGRLLSETSTNYSIWIDASTANGVHKTTFSSTRRDEDGVARHIRFAM